MKARNMARCALGAALLCLCAWIGVPMGTVYVTMQTFGVFACLLLLGGKQGSLTILLYLLLGAVGLPVFSGFRGGIGVLMDATGGYLAGFLVMGLAYWLITAVFGKKSAVCMIACVVGLFLCYAFGTMWYYHLYLSGDSLAAVLLTCVVPFLIPDAVKLALAYLLWSRLKQFV